MTVWAKGICGTALFRIILPVVLSHCGEDPFDCVPTKRGENDSGYNTVFLVVAPPPFVAFPSPGMKNGSEDPLSGP